MEWDRKEAVIQSVGISMARGMEPAQETDLEMERDSGPKKALEPGSVTAQDRKGRAGETERIRKTGIFFRNYKSIKRRIKR